MTRPRLAALLASGVLVITVSAMPLTTAQAAPRACVLAGTGLVENHWQNGDGSWSDSSHWSGGAPPRAGSREYACIPDNVAVTFDADRVDLQAIELGRGSSLMMQEGTALYVWGGPTQESRLRVGSLLLVRGATLGGPGQLHVLGNVEVASTENTQARLSGGDDVGGRMLVGDNGTLDITGAYDARIAGGYSVDVRGRARLWHSAGLVADSGTRFELGPHLDGGHGVGRLVIRNDRGYFASDPTGELSTFVNDGRIVKRRSDGSSAVTADYSGSGEVRIRTGYLVLPDEAQEDVEVAAGASVGAGLCADALTCTTDTTAEEQQFASLALPSQTSGLVEVDVVPLEGVDVPGDPVGDPFQVHADGLTATPSDPVVIQLRYDRSLLKDEGRPFDQAALTVARARGSGQYHPIPDCVSGAIPIGAVACVDRRPKASRTDGDDVIMVVRATRTSRWIVP